MEVDRLAGERGVVEIATAIRNSFGYEKCIMTEKNSDKRVFCQWRDENRSFYGRRGRWFVDCTR